MINCIAIDDEPLALRQMKGYIERTPFLHLVSTFENAKEALEFLKNNIVDLLFVDIQMPGLTGLEFIKSLELCPEVIFITAYKDYALEGFRVNALDYLLKPLDYSTFFASANKAKNYFELIRAKPEKQQDDNNYLFIKSEYKIVRIEIDQLIFVEGMREYVRFHLENAKPVMSLLSMKSIEQRLPSSQFMRVHRSYIVNLKKLNTIERNRIILNNEYIPISDQYKDSFQKYVDDNFLI